MVIFIYICCMRNEYTIFLILLNSVLFAQGNSIRSEPTQINAFTSYGYALEFNAGFSQSYIFGIQYNEHLISFRYTSGREWATPTNILSGYVYPNRLIRSMSLMYNNHYSEFFRMGFGVALSRGNTRGETIMVDQTGDRSVTWHEDISYVSIGASYDLTAIPVKYKGLQVELFLRGEVNFYRFYNTIGIGLGYTFPNF